MPAVVFVTTAPYDQQGLMASASEEQPKRVSSLVLRKGASEAAEIEAGASRRVSHVTAARQCVDVCLDPWHFQSHMQGKGLWMCEQWPM